MYDVNVNREAAFTTYSYRLKYPIGDAESWINEIMKHETRMKKLLEKENLDSFGVVTQPDLLDYSAFHKLRDELCGIVTTLLSNLYVDEAKIELNDSWANIYRENDHAPLHIHQNSHWSCVYYLTSTGDSPLYFKDPRPTPIMDSSVPLLKNRYNQLINKTEFQPGELIIFPSWLEHGVSINRTSDIRVSVACNFRVTDGH